MQKINTCLWFDSQALEAAEFYTSIFADSEILDVSHYGKEGFDIHGRPEGSVMTVSFQLEGRDFLALNGGPHFQFTPAISLIVNCETQEELDALWSKLSANPRAEQCGWLQDRFGLSWQIVPAAMAELMNSDDPVAAGRVMNAMLQMKKMDITALRKARAG